MPVRKLLETAFVWLVYALTAVFVGTTILQAFVPNAWTGGAAVSGLGDGSGVALSVIGFTTAMWAGFHWLVACGRDQSDARKGEAPPRAGVESRTFGYRYHKAYSVVARVSAGLLLLPLLTVPVLLGVGSNEWRKAWPAMLTLGVCLTPFAWYVWTVGRRYATSQVVVDAGGVWVRSMESNGRFGWDEIVAFRKVGSASRSTGHRWVWVLVTADDRVLSVAPSLRGAAEFVALVERTSGIPLEVVP